MPTAIQADTFKRKDKVVASEAMPGIPEGTPGRVTMVAGFDWIRYWVYFENGVSRGSLNRSKLARASEWGAVQARRASGADHEHAPAGGGEAAGDSDAGEADSGEGYLYNGTLVPQLLLERSKRARERLGA
jgi:hypothetical protein